MNNPKENSKKEKKIKKITSKADKIIASAIVGGAIASVFGLIFGTRKGRKMALRAKKTGTDFKDELIKKGEKIRKKINRRYDKK